MPISRTSMARAVAIALVAGIILLGFGTRPASARAVRMTFAEDFMILAPLEPDSAIIAQLSSWYVFTPSPNGVVPQGGDFSLDWDGGGGLPAGHYEGTVNCNVYVVSIQESPPLVTAWGECVVRSPGAGVIIENPIWVTNNYWCPSETGDQPFRMEWDMHIRATGVYAGLSGDGVAVVAGVC